MAVAEMTEKREKIEEVEEKGILDPASYVMAQIKERLSTIRYMRETIKQVAPHSYRVNFFKQTTGRIDSYFVTVDENGVIISSNPPLP